LRPISGEGLRKGSADTDRRNKTVFSGGGDLAMKSPTKSISRQNVRDEDARVRRINGGSDSGPDVFADAESQPHYHVEGHAVTRTDP